MVGFICFNWYSTGWRRLLRFSTGRRRPDFKSVATVATEQTEVFYWSTVEKLSFVLVDGRRLRADFFITPFFILGHFWNFENKICENRSTCNFFIELNKHCLLYILTSVWVFGTPNTGQISFFHFFGIIWQYFEAKMKKVAK